MHYSMVKLPEQPMMPRVFDERVGYFTVQQIDYGRDEHRAAAPPLHLALAAREEGPERGDLRAGEADRLLRRSGDAGEVGAVHQERHRELEAGVRRGRFQERDSRQGRAVEGAGLRLECRGRALFGDPLAALDDRERVWSAYRGPAHRRDSRGRHPDAPQRDEPGARLVLRAGRSARSARREAAAARRSRWAS